VIKSKSQTLITGVYRSGTEYITQLIGSHSDISATMYQINMFRNIKNRFEPISDKFNYKRAVEFCASISKDRGFNLDYDVDSIVSALNKYEKVNEYIVYDVIMSFFYVDRKVAHWAEKCQLEWREISCFVDNMDNGYGVHIIRDPRSVLGSFKKHTNSKKPLYLTSIFNSLDSLQQFINDQGSDRICTIRYEDVLKNRLQQITLVWKMLGLKGYNDDIFNSDKWTNQFGNKWQSNSHSQKKSTVDNFDSDYAINEWKYSLTKEEVSLVEHVCGDAMKKCGYQLSGEKLSAKILKTVKDNDILNNMMLDSERKNVGIQAFPYSPLDRDTWDRSK